MLSWLDASEFQRFGEALAAKVDTLAGPQRKRKLSAHEVRRRLLSDIDSFKQQHQGNFYKKAKFGNAFKWKLLQAGHDQVFVDDLTNELMVHFR